MIQICLIRHGETDWNAKGIIQGLTDTELNENGLHQAQKCAEYLSKETWEMVITSPLKRAKQTASILANKLGINLLEMEDFVEKDYGKLDGLPLQQQTWMDKQIIMDKNRTLSGLEHLRLNKKYTKILLVTHGDVIQIILSSLFSETEYQSIVKNASFTEMEYSRYKWKLKSYNQTSHL